MQTRQFTDKPAAREAVPLLIGLMGPSGGGKTFSALRIATGIQRLNGGEIGYIDTEARRALHYADQFKFRHLDFKAPFGPLDYLAALRHFEGKGVKTIIVDSLSHEHEGEGGVLDQHEEGMQGKESRSMIAWAKPKKERRELINGILQMQCNFIFCFRAKQKMKPIKDHATGKTVPTPQGYMPIAADEFLFEMTACALLLPRSNGIPDWNPLEPGEKLMTKLPEQFFDIFGDEKGNARQIDETIGEKLAEWAKGGVSRNLGAPAMREAIKPPASQENAPDGQDLSFNGEIPEAGPSRMEVIGPITIKRSQKNPDWSAVVCSNLVFPIRTKDCLNLREVGDWRIEYRVEGDKNIIERIEPI